TMPKQPPDDAQDDIPELEDVVEPTAPAEPVPPPNFDLFEAAGPDLAALRDALVARLHDEIDAMASELHADVAQVLRARIDDRLRARLAEILDGVLGGPGKS